MAEPEELDEDLFADLYDADESTTQVQHGLIQNSPTKAQSPALPAYEPVTEMNMGDEGQAYTNDVQADQYHENEYDHEQIDQTWPANDHDDDIANNSSTIAPEHSGIAIKEDGKMFIGGLNWETTDESLRRHFEEFGEVVECTVMRDAATGRSRGFGFLTFKDPKTVNIVMVKEHFLDGKIIDPKRAIPRDEQERTSKIFVGGVSQEATDEDFKSYFMQFGRVIDATLMIDKDTKRPRGFGFVTFDSEAAVEATLRGDLRILGKPIEVKRAQPRGNVKEEEEKLSRASRRSGKNEQGRDDSGLNQGQGGGMGYANGMTPQMMAHYFQRMQQYFAQMMANMQGNMAGGMMSGMNPAMMQQMAQMQQRMQQQGGQGMQGMTPQMMQQIQQMQQMQNQQNGSQASGNGQGSGNGNGNQSTMNGIPTGPAAMANSNTSGRRDQHRQGGNSIGFNPGGPTSWEGMYDDVPQPDMGAGGLGSGMGSGRGGHGYGRGSRNQAPKQPSAAPANAPTGPKNAGMPGANYRGGGRGNHHRGGYHPYGRR